VLSLEGGKIRGTQCGIEPSGEGFGGFLIFVIARKGGNVI